MAAYRNSRSFTTSRRLPGHAYGTATPIKCCYPYTPASPASMQPSHLELPLCPQPRGSMVQTRQPLLPNPIPIARCLPENPTSDLALALPSLEHLTNALYAHASSQDCATASRRHGKSERHGRRDRRLPSRDRRTASCERRASKLLHCPYREVEHVQMSEAIQPVLEPQPQPAATFETTSPRRKMHYVPATPSHSVYSPQPNSPELKRPSRTALPTPPSSLPASSPKQQLSSPQSSPKLSAPPSPTRSAAEAHPALSKFRRLVLACRETEADNDRIDALIDSYEQIMGSLVDEVVVDSLDSD